MMRRRLLSDQRGSSAAEMVLMMPLLVLLLFGSVEVGYYFYTEHRVIDLARNYSRFAARRVVLQESACPDASAVKTEILARLPIDMPYITDWNTASDVTIDCDSGVTTGIYESTGRDGPVVTVKTQGTYPTMFAFLGFTDARWTVSATQHAALIGW